MSIFKKIYLINLLSLIIILFFSAFNLSYSQEKGAPPPKYNPDSTIIFQSARPLVNIGDLENPDHWAWGFDLIVSNNGFGGGLFLNKYFSKDLFVFASLYLSGARNTDENDQYIYDTTSGIWDWKVPNKINRLYEFPLMIGVTQSLFTDVLSENFKPYVSAGLGPSFILSTPYSKEFFSAFKYSQFYVRFGSFVGIGANFVVSNKSLAALNLRYYFIPFGGNGLESLMNLPIKNFGGIFLSLSLGAKN
jgi:hypothetical protein